MTRPAEDVWRMSTADAYRERLDELVSELDLLPELRRLGDVRRLLHEWARLADVRRILRAVPGGAERVIEQSLGEYATFQPSQASNARDAVTLVRIILLQQLDLAWWASTPDLLDERAIQGAAELVDLRAAKAAGGVRFGFGVGSDRLTRRARDFTVQRLRPNREPRGPGLPFAYARMEVIAILNEIADRVRLLAPRGTPPIWVNSIVRTVSHQRHLSGLGFTAFLPSAHCRGYAADIEMQWFERFGAGGVLRDVLLDYLAAGLLNVIDEGRAWHVCLAPHAARRYGAAGAAGEGFDDRRTWSMETR